MRLALIVTWTVALGLTGSGATAAQSASSGVAGQVVARTTAGLGCFRAPCYQPASHVVVTFSRPGRVVRVTAGRRGEFRAALAAGLWTVRAPGLRSLTGNSLVVRVPTDSFVRLTLVVVSADTPTAPA